MVKIILRLEGAAFFFASIVVYYLIHGNWIVFVVLLLVPDISMVGYLRNNKLGSITYNLVHNYILAAIIIIVGYLLNTTFFIELGIILFAHVAMDRMLGFGLKYPDKFKHTHLQKV